MDREVCSAGVGVGVSLRAHSRVSSLPLMTPVQLLHTPGCFQIRILFFSIPTHLLASSRFSGPSLPSSPHQKGLFPLFISVSRLCLLVGRALGQIGPGQIGPGQWCSAEHGRQLPEFRSELAGCHCLPGHLPASPSFSSGTWDWFSRWHAAFAVDQQEAVRTASSSKPPTTGHHLVRFSFQFLNFSLPCLGSSFALIPRT